MGADGFVQTIALRTLPRRPRLKATIVRNSTALEYAGTLYSCCKISGDIRATIASTRHGTDYSE